MLKMNSRPRGSAREAQPSATIAHRRNAGANVVSRECPPCMRERVAGGLDSVSRFDSVTRSRRMARPQLPTANCQYPSQRPAPNFQAHERWELGVIGRWSLGVRVNAELARR